MPWDDRLSRSSLLFENDLFRKPVLACDPNLGLRSKSWLAIKMQGRLFPHHAAGEREWNE
jgi:hypothetical protein